MERPTVICLTPVKNEAWVLERFLRCASVWADHIIIADQKSTDSCQEIARQFKKVIIMENPSPTYNEFVREKLLIEAARNIPGPRLFVALDADEALTANFMDSVEWDMILRAPRGTVIRFQWVNLLPDFLRCWVPDYDFPWGFMDDEAEHVGAPIHSPRVPVPTDAPVIKLSQIKVLHYQYTDWSRMKSKQRWYQLWERINRPDRRPVENYRVYHRMDAIDAATIRPVLEEWFVGYEKQGIDMRNIKRENVFWYDKEILEWFDKYQTKHFRREAIWDVDWPGIAEKFGVDGNLRRFRDPRNGLERLIHRWLKRTQRTYGKRHIRTLEKILGAFDW
jgi:glycosyltransferase involved in cell wall biosynthesis